MDYFACLLIKQRVMKDGEMMRLFTRPQMMSLIKLTKQQAFTQPVRATIHGNEIASLVSNAIWQHRSGSGNGLLPDATEPLPEPMLTKHQLCSVAFTWEQYKSCFWLFHILMPYNVIILIFIYLIFMSQIVLYFLHSTSVLSFYIDIVLTLSTSAHE